MLPSEHQIGSGMTHTELEAASWWVKHHLTVRRLGYGSLGVLSALFWGYTLWSYADAYLISWPRESRIHRNIVQHVVPLEAIQQVAPQPLQLAGVRAFESTDDRLDLLSGVTNPNPLWSARITYAFKLGEQTTPSQEAVVLPQSTRPVVALGSRGSGDPEFVIQAVQWRRVTLDSVGGSYPAYAAERQDFVFSEEPSYLSLGDGLGTTDFTITNNSGYGYWKVELYVTLLRQGIPLAVNRVDVRELKPNETRPISLQWLQEFGGVDQVEITPYVNILDQASYLPTTRL